MTEAEKEWIYHVYSDNNMKKLRNIIYPMFKKFGGVSAMDFDDFLSRANLTLWQLVESYDETRGVPFEAYLRKLMPRKMMQEKTYDGREIRTPYLRDNQGRIVKDEEGNYIKLKQLRMDEPTEDGVDLIEKIDSGQYVDSALLSEILNDKTQEYFNSLNKTQQRIATMIMKDCDMYEIKEEMNLDDKELSSLLSDMRSYDKRRILYKEYNLEGGEMETAVITNDVAETYKNTSYSIESISKQIHNNRIRDNHILQRYSNQWQKFAKSELVSDILRGKSLTQIIISEEIRGGLRMQWLIDGKQRCTTVDDYLHDGFAISRNIKNYMICYQTTKYDENGEKVLNEDGFTEVEYREFDIRGKKFSQLPEELQDIFRDRQIPVLYNMNCSKKDIAEDIARFNRSRPMNQAQSGWLGLDESFAELVENISKMPFFQTDFNGSKYTKKNHTDSGMRRIIVESVVVSDFLDKYNSDFNKMCKFLSEEASDSNFTDFYSLVDRLTNICDDSTASFFDAKDSTLWFGLFSRFINKGFDDRKFREFLIEFSDSDEMKNKEINGVTYNSLCVNKETGKARSNKDKSVMVAKLKLLEALLDEFLGVLDGSIKNFIAESVGFDRDTIDDEDLNMYKETLEDLLDRQVLYGSPHLEQFNRLSLLAIMAYSYREDIDLDDWITDYTKRNATYLADQRENYLKMKSDLIDYCRANKHIA